MTAAPRREPLRRSPGQDEDGQPAVGGGNLVARLSATKLVSEAIFTAARRPESLRLLAKFAGECGSIALGTSSIAPDPRDSRFADPTWHENEAYRRLMQTYLAWADLMKQSVDAPTEDWRQRARADFGVELITSALSPTNYLVSNPAVLKRAFETGGMSVLRGGRNLLRDMLQNEGVPTQVEPGRYRVGHELAVTPGSVVARTDLYELLQYAPATERVQEIPVVVIPPVINRHYFVDLAPGKSFVEYLVGAGFTVFLPVWRNPRPGAGHTTLDDYVSATLDILDTVADISGHDDVNVFGSCTGGNVALPAAAVSAARGEQRIKSLGLAASMITYDAPSAVGMIASEKAVADLRRDANRGGLVAARDIEQGFGWLKPDQLVWSFVVNDWLMGNEPPGGDVMAWSNSPTATPSGLAADLVEISLRDSFREPGRLRVLGTPVDLSALKQDNYVVAGQKDHISPWKACYSATELLGGTSRFVLTPVAHAPTMISPLDSPKARYYAGPEGGCAAGEWLDAAQEQKGSWWVDYADWLRARSGDQRPAPTSLGSARYPVLEAAPGRYASE